MKRTNLVDIRLTPNKDDRAQVMAFGDLHCGAATCDYDLMKTNIQHCLDNGVYMVGMGDMMEAGLRDSVGDSVYHQTMNPDEQIDFVIDLFRPVQEAGLLIGLHSGN